MQLPDIVLTKQQLRDVLHVLQTTGVPFLKQNGSSSSAAPKTLFVDRGSTAVYYSPSDKLLAKRLILFHNITAVLVDLKDMCHGLQGTGKRVELRIVAIGRKKPLIASMTEVDGIMVSQAIAKRVRNTTHGTSVNLFQRRIREVWLVGDADGNGGISFDELVQLCRTLNIRMPSDEIKRKFDEVDADQSNSLEYPEFVRLFTMLTTIPYLEGMFKHYGAPVCKSVIGTPEDEMEEEVVLTAEGIQQFFAEAQGEEVDLFAARGLVHMYSSHSRVPASNNQIPVIGSSESIIIDSEALNAKPVSPTTSPRLVGLTLHDFSMFMVDTAHNGWFDVTHDRVFMSMRHPLHHYFIACSHNTYSSGSQFSSKSKTEMYHRVLRQGCRCVEIDCHTGASTPMVYHHYTPTSEISFEDVVDAIKESAFVASPYPVILSLEVHTDDKQTSMLASILKSKLGAALLLPQELAPDLSNFTPHDLMHRILVKWKAAPQQHSSGSPSLESTTVAPPPASGGEPLLPKSPVAATPLSKKSAKASPGADELRSLVTVAGVHSKTGLGNKVSDIQSTSEGDLEKHAGIDLQLKNARMMTRGYPSGSRMMDSSNMDPVLPWTQGVQMVAMNYQTWDEPMLIHEGKFRVNGRCGYVLKPPCLRTEEGIDDVYTRLPVPKPLKLSVRVLFGFQLFHLPASGVDTLDPFVEVSVRECRQVAPSAFEFGGDVGLSSPLAPGSEDRLEASLRSTKTKRGTAKTVVTSKKTAIVNRNGFMPFWNDVFEFAVVNVDLAILSVHVKDNALTSVKSVGYASIPVRSLMLGYRAVPLVNPQGDLLHGSALVCNFGLS